jgi:hypothetical protein
MRTGVADATNETSDFHQTKCPQAAVGNTERDTHSKVKAVPAYLNHVVPDSWTLPPPPWQPDSAAAAAGVSYASTTTTLQRRRSRSRRHPAPRPTRPSRAPSLRQQQHDAAAGDGSGASTRRDSSAPGPSGSGAPRKPKSGKDQELGEASGHRSERTAVGSRHGA